MVRPKSGRGFLLKQDTCRQHKIFHLFTAPGTASCYSQFSLFLQHPSVLSETQNVCFVVFSTVFVFAFFSRALHCSIFVYFADEAKAGNATNIVNIAQGKRKESAAAPRI